MLKAKKVLEAIRHSQTLNEEIYCSAQDRTPRSENFVQRTGSDMSQFNNERQLFSIHGLTPCEHSSGDTTQGLSSWQETAECAGVVRGCLESTEQSWKEARA